jgi:predicted transcriptional regulator
MQKSVQRGERKVKAVLISIKPKWCDLIRRGRKTVEVRKTCPKLEVPFKVYIYETMDGGRGSGLVFGEFVCNGFDVFRPIGKGISIKRFPALYESCLTLDEIVKYAQGEPVYGWQISQLKLYEEPLKLEDFSRHGFCGMNGTGVCGNTDCENYQPSCNYMEPPTCAINGCILYEAPQSWCYVEERKCSE